MFVLIVGGDRLGCIPKELDKLGIKQIQHISGRGGQKIRRTTLGKKVFIILLYDFVNHNLANKMKRFAHNQGIPIVYARRSWTSIYKNIIENRQQLSKAGLRF
ncbi:MAG: DUF2325 domain-containing protein [wastewater metagenome]|nr:DUF2325 domain-containing protein [Candidatus Loosdrechtia aerotolerans]